MGASVTYVDLIQLTLAIGGSLVLAVIFGKYLARMIVYEKRPLEKTLGIVENKFYNLIGIDRYQQMTWKEYFTALMVTNLIAIGFFFAMLVLQQYLPLATKEGFSLDLAFHTAISFVSGTNLQHYTGDHDMSVLTQMIGIVFMMFVAPATGISAAFAFIRGFIRKDFGLGNFYVDFIRVIVTFLLPIAFVSALLLVFLGVPQTLQSEVMFQTLEGKTQTLTMGPVASLESIKELGSNGGGFFGSNSAHPFENPNGVSNIFEIILILAIPLSFPIAYAHLLGRGRGMSILIAMLASFALLLAIGFATTSGPTGLETRFGSFGSVLFDISSIATNTGAANSALTGLSSNAVISLFLGMFVQAIPGADGTGMMTMLVYVISTLFIVGLMVGKTPEFMSMKISSRDIKLAIFIFLIHPAAILVPTVIAFANHDAQKLVGDVVTPIGFTQTLYEF
ncbi:MAG TPA: potassium-transporting ATPase subunit KdpA, partial [Candidatus Nitrosotenuis sp.]|nr:potassium-transporting ATPase subunit KdpA [Candidatus Nitrosotenuis sp.]